MLSEKIFSGHTLHSTTMTVQFLRSMKALGNFSSSQAQQLSGQDLAHIKIIAERFGVAGGYRSPHFLFQVTVAAICLSKRFDPKLTVDQVLSSLDLVIPRNFTLPTLPGGHR